MISAVLDVEVFDDEAVRRTDVAVGNERGCDDDETRVVVFGTWLVKRYIGNGEIFDIEERMEVLLRATNDDDEVLDGAVACDLAATVVGVFFI